MDNRGSVYRFIQQNPRRDDDEIAAATGVLPRQQVNQICRALAKEGLIRRFKDTSRARPKIVNEAHSAR